MKAKKNIKILAFGLMALLTLNTFAGCNAIGGGDNSDDAIQQTNENVLQNSLINGFSDIKDVYQIILENSFGKVNLNKDKTYVLTGDASAKLSIGHEGVLLTSRPILKQRLSSQIFDYNYTDFTKVKKVKAQIYNPSDEVRVVRACINFSDGKTTSQKIYSVKKGWNDIIYEIDRTLLSFQVDLKKASYFQLSFETDPEKSYDLYLDNISITQTSTPMEMIEMTVEENEICYFEQNYQNRRPVFLFSP